MLIKLHIIRNLHFSCLVWLPFKTELLSHRSVQNINMLLVKF